MPRKTLAMFPFMQCTDYCCKETFQLDLWFITEWSEIETLYIMAWPQKGPHMSSIAFLKPLEPGPQPKAFGYNTVPVRDKKPAINQSEFTAQTTSSILIVLSLMLPDHRKETTNTRP